MTSGLAMLSQDHSAAEREVNRELLTEYYTVEDKPLPVVKLLSDTTISLWRAGQAAGRNYYKRSLFNICTTLVLFVLFPNNFKFISVKLSL